MAKRGSRQKLKWRAMDLHIHTPVSSDYQQPDVTYLQILQQAEVQGLDIIAITDHNSITGYRQMLEEIEQLELLKKLNRLLPEEEVRLKEFNRLMKKLLVLPGIEFTATFGFHILGIFPLEKPVREIEHLLLSLQIDAGLLDEGSPTVGATTDVLTAYRLINEAGGLVIAAHANSSNGVAMRGFRFGGQTKIAYTQDPNLHALEVTDLEQKGRRTTAAFFNGTKPEYPRRMHCIQGSDAHRLTSDTQRQKNFGVGDRATEVLLPEVSFQAIKDLFLRNDFARTRPRRHKEQPYFDFIQAAREEGPNIIQDFHESMTVRGGHLYAIISDICSFANTNGGTLYIGLNADPKSTVVGITNPNKLISQLEKEITKRISPPLACTIDVQKTGGKDVLRVLVPRCDEPPCAVDDNKIYVRSESETELAVRDEIVDLVMRTQKTRQEVTIPAPDEAKTAALPLTEEAVPTADDADDTPPRTGVEIVSVEVRRGTRYYTVRDLRNENVVKNVTRTSARRLWHYAISRFAKIPDDLSGVNVEWHGQLGLLRKHKHGKIQRYDLIQRSPDKNRFYFGVTDDGIHGAWKKVVGSEDA